MGLSLLWTIDRAFQPKSRERRMLVSAPPSALSTTTRVCAQSLSRAKRGIAPQRCPILCTSALILTFLAGGMFFVVNF